MNHPPPPHGKNKIPVAAVYDRRLEKPAVIDRRYNIDRSDLAQNSRID
jgi:hypothetical protein